MIRRVVLVALDWGRAKDPAISLGHASIIARLAMEPDIEVVPISFSVNAPGFRKEDVLAAIIKAVAGRDAFVAIGAFIWNERVVKWLLPALRCAGFNGQIILGGPQVSYAPPGVDSLYPEANVFIRGHAEDALAELVKSNGFSLPVGVSLHGADTMAQSAMPDLALLPSPLLTGTFKPGHFVRWEAQRGCPYSCSFCQHRESGSRMRFRVLPPGRLMRELEVLVSSGVGDIAVLDPVFNMNPHAEAILRLLANLGYLGRLSLQCRFELLTPTFLDACRPLNVTLEFGLQTIHDAEMRAIRRRNDLPKAERAIEMLRERGIHFEVSLIYGLPEQSTASFRASVDWCRDHRVPVIRAFPLMLLRGTELATDRDQWQLVESEDAIPVVVESSTFSRAEWHEMNDLASALEQATVGTRTGHDRIRPDLLPSTG